MLLSKLKLTAVGSKEATGWLVLLWLHSPVEASAAGVAAKVYLVPLKDRTEGVALFVGCLRVIKRIAEAGCGARNAMERPLVSPSQNLAVHNPSYVFVGLAANTKSIQHTIHSRQVGSIAHSRGSERLAE